MEEARNVSIAPQHRAALPEVSRETINEPGAYVERSTGDLYRIPKEVLIAGASPMIRKDSAGASRQPKLSTNPFVTALAARLLTCEHNVQPNF